MHIFRNVFLRPRATTFVLSILILFSGLTFAQQRLNVKDDYAPNRVIVKFNKLPDKHASAQFKEDFKSEIGVSSVKRLDLIQAEVLDISGSTVEDVILKYKNDPRIKYIEPDYVVHASVLPNDPQYGTLWGMAKIQAPQAWDSTTGGSVLLGVIDSGVDYLHPDLAANIWTNPGEIDGNGIDDDVNGYVDDIHGYDWVNNDNNPMDDNSHGTHVAGTIAASGNNNIGVVGVNWTARIMALKFLNASNSGFISNAILAIQYATRMGAVITNNSWGGGDFSQALYDAIYQAGLANSLFIAAAGNNGTNQASYPALYDLDNIISVAATDQNDIIASFSQYNAVSVDLGAPGVAIQSTFPNNTYGANSGTSMAAPHVTGAAALILAKRPSLSADDVKAIILNSVDPIASLTGKTVTGGRLNVFNAISLTGTWIPFTPPVIGVSPPSVSFTLAPDANSSDVFTINNAGSNAGKLKWTISPPACGWLSTDKSSGQLLAGTSEQIQIYADAFGLDPGNYQCSLTITSNDPANPFMEVIVNLEVLYAPPPIASVFPASLSLSLMSGDNINSPITLSNLANTGSRSLHWSAAITGASSWLDLSRNPFGVTPPADSNQLFVFSSAVGLLAGIYQDTIDITTNDPAKPLIRVPVRLTVLSTEISGQKIYTFSINPVNIFRADLDGSNASTPFPGVARPGEGDVHEADRKLYWLENFNTVVRANLDGTSKEVALSSPGSSFHCMTLDVQNNHIYIIGYIGSPYVYRFYRANLDGSGFITIGDVSGWNFTGLTVDPAQGKLYWAALGANNNKLLDGIWRANLDLSQPELVTNQETVRAFALDLNNREMYWTARDTVRKGTMNGLNIADVFVGNVHGDLEVDPVGGKLYWTRQLVNGSEISYDTERANLDGTNIESLHIPGWKIALDLSIEEIILPVAVTINTSPAGLSFTVDDTVYTGTQTFQWMPASVHSVASTSPQILAAGTQYVFQSWSDSGAISHSITTPADGANYTVSFKTQHQLTTTAGAGGTISPASGFYDQGNILVTAAANAGYKFKNFTGSLSGTVNPQTLNLTAPAGVTANFELLVTQVCPKNQNYWKNNPAAWPASALPMRLGKSRTYTKSQLLTILKTSAGSGKSADASLILAHQLISAKLNIASGSGVPGAVSLLIFAADNAIGTKQIPMKVKTSTTDGKIMVFIAAGLEKYNMGLLTSGCSSTIQAAEVSTEELLELRPEKFELEQNYPNPFNPTTTIQYSLPVDAQVTLDVYDMLGQRVAELVNEYSAAGYHKVEFNATGFASGIYFYRMSAEGEGGENFTHVQKLILLK